MNETVGAVFTFNGTQVQSRVGISWINTSKACAYVETEIPTGTKLSTLVQSSKDTWNAQVLSKITTNDDVATNLANIQQLYFNLYAMFIIPSNRTTENSKWPKNSAEVYYDDIFTYWDLVSTTTSNAERELTHVSIAAASH